MEKRLIILSSHYFCHNMKIIYLSNEVDNIGGIEKYNKDLINQLKAYNVNVQNIKIKSGPYFFSRIHFVLKTLYHLIINKYDYMVCGHLNFVILGLLGLKIFKLNYSVSLYGIEAIAVKKTIHRIGIVNSNKIIVISEYTKKLISSQFKLDEKNFFMLKSSVDENLFNINYNESTKSELGIKENEIFLLTLSRISNLEEKGHHRILLALKSLLNIYPNIKYVISGPGFDTRISCVLERFPILKDSVIFTGQVSESEKIKLYNACDFFILLSKNEGFGIVFIEALSCGANVIASDGYGCREALYEGDLGILVDPDNIDLIAKALEDAIQQKIYQNKYENKEKIRQKTIDIYGKNPWKNGVKQFIDEIKML